MSSLPSKSQCASDLTNLRRKRRTEVLPELEWPGALRWRVSESSTQSLLCERHVNAVHTEIGAVRLVAVVVGLVRAFDGNGQILGLLRRELGEPNGKLVEMQSRHFLVQLFRLRIDAALVGIAISV